MKDFLRRLVEIVIAAVGICLLYEFTSVATWMPNTQASLAQGGLVLVATSLGAVWTPFVAFFGHLLYDSLNYTNVWWTWVVADGVFGLLIGLVVQRLELLTQPLTWQQIVRFNGWQALANGLVWGGLAPLGDYLVYQSAWRYVFLQGGVAALVNTLSVGVVGTLFIYGYHWMKKH